MRKLLTCAAAVVLVFVLAAPAEAGQVGVNAGRSARAWDSNDWAYVIVDPYGGQVSVTGYSLEDPDIGWEAHAWFTVRVTGVKTGVTLTVAVRATGDCSSRSVTFKRRHGKPSTVIVRVAHDSVDGDSFDCTYRRVIVKW